MLAWREELDKAICKEIASHTPFSIEDVRTAYKKSKSFDKVLEAVDVCGQWGLHSIEFALDFKTDELNVE
jgi:hypothetical protein